MTGRRRGFTVQLRFEAFRKAATLAGLDSDYALAKRMEVNRSTVARVRQGDLQPGAAFIGGALTALSPMAFDDLFAVKRIEDHSLHQSGSAEQRRN